jgi:hypothetical protein
MNPTGGRVPAQNEIAAVRAAILSTCLPIVWIRSILFTGVKEFA